MKLNTVVCDRLGFLTARGCVFSQRGKNMILPASSQDLEYRRMIDIRTMISHPESPRIYDAYFAKRIEAFVRDKEREVNKDQSLIVLAIYGNVELKTGQLDNIVSTKYFHMCKGDNERVTIHMIALSDEKEFAFELVDETCDEPKSCFLKYNKITRIIDVIDLSDENHRHQPKSETPLSRLWKRTCLVTRDAAKNFFRSR